MKTSSCGWGVVKTGGGAFVVALACIVSPVRAQNLIRNGRDTGITTPGFLFEPEVPMASLKTAPIWNEIEQLLDDPYGVAPCASLPTAPLLLQNTPGAGDGRTPGVPADFFPSYCTVSVVRRPGFGVALPPLLVSPLNYDLASGEEMRLLNPKYPGGDFDISGSCTCIPAGVAPAPGFPACDVGVPFGVGAAGEGCVPPVNIVAISPGADRAEPGEAAIDLNTPFSRDTRVCIVSTEIPEGALICGGDPGEPDYLGFGVLDNPDTPAGYSTPGVPLAAGASPTTVLTPSDLLYDPERGFIPARDPVTGAGGLRKPSIRIPELGGSPSAPNYLVNSHTALEADPSLLAPSNENDYVLSRARAIQLGKALFWDMQVGSDGVQSCGTCHFAAGADSRTKNQLNPNHLGGDLTFQLHQPNEELVPTDFPLHKLADPSVAGDPACTTPILASVDAGVLENNFPGGATDVPVCDAANEVSDTNDVVSSMGVHFGRFFDIPPPGPGAFGPATQGVSPLLPDLRSPDPAQNVDPILGFAGTDGSGHQFRRVEPRNTPTIFAAAFNFDNFWDGRARHDFNGGSVFGAADPQDHVYVDDGTGLVPTRQLIRFVSLASLATGPGLSEFEMSFAGRNWSKIGKKLLQAGATPLANQLVDPTDSVLGLWSNQGGTECAARGRATAAGKPGLCTTYTELIQESFYPSLWQNTTSHLVGCYTDGDATLHPNQCAGTPPIPTRTNEANTADPFDGYVLTPAAGEAVASDTNQFTQMEGNFSLFWGLSLDLWVQVLVPDDTPFDQFLDENPDAFMSLGESGEPGLVADMPLCTSATQRSCVREVGLFKRDSNVACTTPGVTNCAGTRAPGSSAPDPLLGLDLFEGSNLSLKNPNFRSARCGECHALPTLTDHTIAFTHKAQIRDFVGEFLVPGVESSIEPLGRLRVISGFMLEAEMNENGQDGVERRIINQSIAPNPTDGLAYPDGVFNPDGSAGNFGTTDARYTGAGAAYFDNGVYNIGVRPIGEDIGRGGDDAFGWPLSLAALMLKNVGGPDFEPNAPPNPITGEPGSGSGALTTFTCLSNPCDPVLDQTGGLFGETSQDQQINPGFSGDDVVTPLLPPYLAPFANAINVGDAPPEMDEVFSGLNTLTDIAMLEGFLDTLGPFNPAGVLPESLNSADGAQMGTWPVVNRVGRMGSFKAPQLRNVELTGPYFHNGGMLTLRQVVDFYSRGGDFPVTNAAHRDFNILNQTLEVQSNLSEAEKVALVDFLLTLTDERVAHEQAPFDRPEFFVPLDGTAPENDFGRPGFEANLANGMFLHLPAVGAGGRAAAGLVPARLPNFLGIASTPDPNGWDHYDNPPAVRPPPPPPPPPPPTGGTTTPPAPVAAAATRGGCSSSASGSALTTLLLVGAALLPRIRRRREA
jgi:cytochrome c peroxidase